MLADCYIIGNCGSNDQRYETTIYHYSLFLSDRFRLPLFPKLQSCLEPRLTNLVSATCYRSASRTYRSQEARVDSLNDTSAG
eukprot:s4002_g5.t1